jgi:hypothetical protein
MQPVYHEDVIGASRHKMLEKSMEKTYLVRQYRPGYFSGFEDVVCRNVKYEDIIKVPWCENFKHDDFTEFTISDYHGELIIEAHYASGAHWVVGFALPSDSDLMSNNGDLMRDNWRYNPHKS